MMMRPASVAALLLVLGVGPAFGYCSEPSFGQSEPDAPGSYDKPDVPYCLSGFSYSRQHTCDSWEIDSYKQEVEDYIEKLRDYAEETADFAQAAAEFASEATSYARCEADDVMAQHQ